jgi:hypothetical protein
MVVLAVTPLNFAPIAAIKIEVAIYEVETSLGAVPIKLCSNGLPHDKLLEKALDNFHITTRRARPEGGTPSISWHAPAQFP